MYFFLKLYRIYFIFKYLYYREYPEEEYIDQQIVLLNHYLYTDITNAELLFKELEEKSYEKMTHKQQSEFDLMKSSAYFLNETKSIL